METDVHPTLPLIYISLMYDCACSITAKQNDRAIFNVLHTPYHSIHASLDSQVIHLSARSALTFFITYYQGIFTKPFHIYVLKNVWQKSEFIFCTVPLSFSPVFYASTILQALIFI